MLLSSLTSGIIRLLNSKLFSYVHNSASTSDLNFVLTDPRHMLGAIVDTSRDILATLKLAASTHFFSTYLVFFT